MKTEYPRVIPIIHPKPKYFVSDILGNVIAETWAIDNCRLTIVSFKNRVPMDWYSPALRIATFCHN